MDKIEEIDDYLAAAKMTESKLGMLACANARAVKRIRIGTASIATLRAVERYMADNQVKKVAT